MIFDYNDITEVFGFDNDGVENVWSTCHEAIVKPTNMMYEVIYLPNTVFCKSVRRICCIGQTPDCDSYFCKSLGMMVIMG